VTDRRPASSRSNFVEYGRYFFPWNTVPRRMSAGCGIDARVGGFRWRHLYLIHGKQSPNPFRVRIRQRHGSHTFWPAVGPDAGDVALQIWWCDATRTGEALGATRTSQRLTARCP